MLNQNLLLSIRNLQSDDLDGVIDLQKKSFPHMVDDGEIWRMDELERYLRVFPEGQFCAIFEGKIVGSASSLIVSLEPDYRIHTWDEICYDCIERTFNPKGNILYDVDVSTDPAFRRFGIGTRLYNVRKELAKKLNLKKIISAARLSSYSAHSDLSPEDYVAKASAGVLCDPVLNFQLKNGFRFIKILPGYMNDSESCGFAALTEWINEDYVSQ